MPMRSWEVCRGCTTRQEEVAETYTAAMAEHDVIMEAMLRYWWGVWVRHLRELEAEDGEALRAQLAWVLLAEDLELSEQTRERAEYLLLVRTLDQMRFDRLFRGAR